MSRNRSLSKDPAWIHLFYCLLFLVLTTSISCGSTHAFRFSSSTASSASSALDLLVDPVESQSSSSSPVATPSSPSLLAPSSSPAHLDGASHGPEHKPHGLMAAASLLDQSQSIRSRLHKHARHSTQRKHTHAFKHRAWKQQQRMQADGEEQGQVQHHVSQEQEDEQEQEQEHELEQDEQEAAAGEEQHREEVSDAASLSMSDRSHAEMEQVEESEQDSAEGSDMQQEQDMEMSVSNEFSSVMDHSMQDHAEVDMDSDLATTVSSLVSVSSTGLPDIAALIAHMDASAAAAARNTAASIPSSLSPSNSHPKLAHELKSLAATGPATATAAKETATTSAADHASIPYLSAHERFRHPKVAQDASGYDASHPMPLDLLGGGSTGAVYRAYDMIHGREVAIKVPAVCADPDVECHALRTYQLHMQLARQQQLTQVRVGMAAESMKLFQAEYAGNMIASLYTMTRPYFVKTYGVLLEVDEHDMYVPYVAWSKEAQGDDPERFVHEQSQLVRPGHRLIYWSLRSTLKAGFDRRAIRGYVYELCYGDMRHSVQRVMKYTDAFKHDMMLHLLKGATLMHQLGLVHRDMKADNIFLCHGILPVDERAPLLGRTPKIGDFGTLAYGIGPSDALSDLHGTEAYLPPELFSTFPLGSHDAFGIASILVGIYYSAMHQYDLAEQMEAANKKQIRARIQAASAAAVAVAAAGSSLKAGQQQKGGQPFHIESYYGLYHDAIMQVLPHPITLGQRMIHAFMALVPSERLTTATAVHLLQYGDAYCPFPPPPFLMDMEWSVATYGAHKKKTFQAGQLRVHAHSHDTSIDIRDVEPGTESLSAFVHHTARPRVLGSERKSSAPATLDKSSQSAAAAAAVTAAATTSVWNWKSHGGTKRSSIRTSDVLGMAPYETQQKGKTSSNCFYLLTRKDVQSDQNDYTTNVQLVRTISPTCPYVIRSVNQVFTTPRMEVDPAATAAAADDSDSPHSAQLEEEEKEGAEEDDEHDASSSTIPEPEEMVRHIKSPFPVVCPTSVLYYPYLLLSETDLASARTAPIPTPSAPIRVSSIPAPVHSSLPARSHLVLASHGAVDSMQLPTSVGPGATLQLQQPQHHLSPGLARPVLAGSRALPRPPSVPATSSALVASRPGSSQQPSLAEPSAARAVAASRSTPADRTPTGLYGESGLPIRHTSYTQARSARAVQLHPRAAFVSSLLSSKHGGRAETREKAEDEKREGDTKTNGNKGQKQAAARVDTSMHAGVSARTQEHVAASMDKRRSSLTPSRLPIPTPAATVAVSRHHTPSAASGDGRHVPMPLAAKSMAMASHSVPVPVPAPPAVTSSPILGLPSVSDLLHMFHHRLSCAPLDAIPIPSMAAASGMRYYHTSMGGIIPLPKVEDVREEKETEKKSRGVPPSPASSPLAAVAEQKDRSNLVQHSLASLTVTEIPVPASAAAPDDAAGVLPSVGSVRSRPSALGSSLRLDDTRPAPLLVLGEEKDDAWGTPIPSTPSARRFGPNPSFHNVAWTDAPMSARRARSRTVVSVEEDRERRERPTN